MDANTMADKLEEKLDRVTSFGSPGYEDFELGSVLTEAMHLYIKKFFDRKNNRKSESFEETEVRNQGLSALIKRGAGLPASTSQVGRLENGTFYDLPEDFMYTIYERVETNVIQCGTPGKTEYVMADVRNVSHGEIERYRNNKYKKPYAKEYGDGLVWRLGFERENDGYSDLSAQTAKRHQLLTDGSFQITDYSINYVRYPEEIIVDRDTPANQRNCILDESTHNVIIDMATDLMMNRVKEQKVPNIEGFEDLE
jgi:hypothetical protein